MPDSLPQREHARWRLPLLALVVLLIVLVPFLLQRVADRRVGEAAAMVAHTLEVENTLQMLSAAIRNLEGAGLARAAGVDAPILDERVAYSEALIKPLLDHAEELTRDNPRQQVRMGALRTSLEERIVQIDRVLAAATEERQAEIRRLVENFPVQAPISALIQTERDILAVRNADAARVQRQARVLAWGSLGAQVLLILGLAALAMRDAGRRTAAEGMSRRADARAGVVLDTVREPIVLIDAGLRVVMHNAAFAELFGIEGDIRGTPLADAGDAWRDEETLRRLRDVLLRGRELWDFERQQRTVDGVDRVMLVNARSMALPDRDDLVALVTASDISAQKASETHIRELNRQLEGKVDQVSDVNRELEAFSYSVSHDLRAPLRHIAGFADKLGRHLGDGLDDKGRHYLDVIGGSAKRMSALIDDLLVYSRLGRSALRLQTVDMQSLVEETRAMLDANNSIDNPGHHVEWRIAHMPVVVGDDNMLRQLWTNLLGNAVKYSTGSEPAVIDVDHRAGDDGLHHFSVRDNGAGFDMAYAGKLFGVFQRLHAASEFSGTGIGLASVKRVVTRHNGQVWAESAPGEGATFHFTLPANPDARQGTPRT
ncbi:ATP-binding protein [Luteimonas sp. MC1825]|uniref:sensor histidine kinase n=1 Tax=Luteimonas sp. MC1825 TaxID=2761107 RepID=UPI001621659C|nr:ATP-binding protein [Luteimonas sp. MC1825]MBB6598273.1 PAS domain-containing protein [Luteimonas sp. MC1825]QOC88486.1 PAS domain-containing protein [Luteimonas sp. MC1825]